MSEWYNYSHKTSVILLPCIIPVLMGVLMPLLMINSNIDAGISALVGFIFGLIISVCLGISNLIAIIKSKKRMKDPEHLMKLMIMNIINQKEYQKLMSKANSQTKQSE